MTSPFAPANVPPARVRVENEAVSIDRITPQFFVMLPSADGQSVEVFTQTQQNEQAAMFVATAIRWAILNGSIGQAMTILATAPVSGSIVDLKPRTDVPPDDIPPHLRNR